jgi:hypothetical protein
MFILQGALATKRSGIMDGYQEGTRKDTPVLIKEVFARSGAYLYHFGALLSELSKDGVHPDSIIVSWANVTAMSDRRELSLYYPPESIAGHICEHFRVGAHTKIEVEWGNLLFFNRFGDLVDLSSLQEVDDPDYRRYIKSATVWRQTEQKEWIAMYKLIPAVSDVYFGAIDGSPGSALQLEAFVLCLLRDGVSRKARLIMRYDIESLAAKYLTQP